MLIHRGLDTNLRFGLVLVKNIMVETKMHMIVSSTLINQTRIPSVILFTNEIIKY